MNSFTELKDCWERLGKEDPLWAILSRDDKKAGKWEIADFLSTGREDINYYLQILRTVEGMPKHFNSILDFGCGVGRLSLAWSSYATCVTGVDISEFMIIQARELSSGFPNVKYVCNPHPDLSDFDSSSFELVFSHICLQHMPWSMARGYLQEFARVCQPGGYVVFQLPSRPLHIQTIARMRRWIVDRLPFGLSRTYRKWRRGTSTIFDMYFTPVQEVIKVCLSFGLKDIILKYDESAGPQTEGFIYLFQKPIRDRFDAT